MIRKLTDEELSRVLGQSAIGKLRHDRFYDPITECYCVAGAALAIAGDYWPDFVMPGTFAPPLVNRAADISLTVTTLGDYPSGPDAILRYLEYRGLA